MKLNLQTTGTTRTIFMNIFPTVANTSRLSSSIDNIFKLLKALSNLNNFWNLAIFNTLLALAPEETPEDNVLDIT